MIIWKLRQLKSVLLDGNIRTAVFARHHAFFAMLLVVMVRIYDHVTGARASKRIEKAIHSFQPKLIGRAFRKEKKTIWKYRELYLIDPEEYYLFGFADLSDSQRQEFVGNREKELLCRALNSDGAWEIFTDKWQTYQRYKDYYGREVLLITEHSRFDEFQAFCKKHKQIIIKPSTSSSGRGIKLLEMHDPVEMEQAFYQIVEAAKECKYVVEEVICQAEVMALFHPQSVNSVRIATFCETGRVSIVTAFFRMGTGNHVVDNAGADGISTAIDYAAGKCKTFGTMENGQRFEYHPDTNVLIPGFQLPDWDELQSIVEELALQTSDQKYIGWDFAYTSDSHWVMVEGNSWGQFVVEQMCTKCGLRKVIEDTFYHYLSKRGVKF